ncbi:MAG: transporter substrate-binding domain-containing protein [Verrucomicrobiota bacterium]|nr:transporter substrate-binding domain-containing protein [Verrucomicrobiota bacterium]
MGMAFAGTGVWVLSGCATPREQDPRPALRIGTLENAPPFSFREQGYWDGVEIELGIHLAARLGMRPEFLPYPENRLERALLNGDVDLIMAGFAITEERRTKLDFANPYLVAGQTALLRAEEAAHYNTAIKVQATTNRVGVLAHSTGEEYAVRYFTRAAHMVFTKQADAVQALLNDEIDLFIYDAPYAWWATLRYEPRLAIAPTLFAREELAWAFRRGSVMLRESANQALADWQANGTLDIILHRWMPVSK